MDGSAVATTYRLEAVEDIKNVKARYFRCVDSKDWKGLEAVFTPDAVFEITYGYSVRDLKTGEWDPPLPPEPVLIRGRDAIIARIREVVEKISTVHHGHMPEISVSDLDRASGIWAMDDELRDSEGRLILAGRGHYHEQYRRLQNQWYISATRLTRLAMVGGDGKRPG